MKHIKLFESFSDNKFYSKIIITDTYDLEPVDFDDREVEKIKHLLSQKGIEEYKTNTMYIGHPSMGGPTKYWMWSKKNLKVSTIGGTPQFVPCKPVGEMAIWDTEKSLFIEKVEDEYFIATEPKDNGPNNIWKIDQIDGLLEFLNIII